jgi:hypothetical protein
MFRNVPVPSGGPARAAQPPKMEHSRKIPQRLPQPGLNRGRLQVAARRLFLLSDVIATSDVTAAGYARKRRPTPRDYEAARRALARYAVPIGRGGGMGRPILWRVKSSVDGSEGGSKP